MFVFLPLGKLQCVCPMCKSLIIMSPFDLITRAPKLEFQLCFFFPQLQITAKSLTHSSDILTLTHNNLTDEHMA